MGDIVSLTCPSCGGKLQISSDISRFACAYCGNEQIIKRGDGIIFLQPVVEGLQKVQTGVDKTASELAIKRIQDEILALQDNRKQEVFEWNRTNMSTQNLITAIGAFPILIIVGIIFLAKLDTLITGLFCATVPIVFVIGIMSLTNIINSEKKKEHEKRCKKYDIAISSKNKELLYHQNVVSRY